MRACVLLALMLLATSGIDAVQDARPVDRALVQRFVDAEPEARRQLAAASPEILSRDFWTGIQGLGVELSKQGRAKDAIRAFDAGVDHGRMTNSPRGQIGSLISLGMVYGLLADYRTAIKHLDESMALTEEGRDDDMIAAAANNLGNIYRRRGEYDKALDAQQRALASNIAANREPQVARTLNNIGVIYEAQGDFRQAVEYFLRSLAIKERLGPPDEVISTLGNIGSVYTVQGNHPQALEYLARALTLSEPANNVRLTANLLSNLGRILLQSGQPEAALQRLHRARELAERAGYNEQLAMILTVLGDVEIERRRWDDAVTYLERARSLLNDIGDPPSMAQVLMSLASIEIERGRAAAGVTQAERARELLLSVGRPTSLIDAEVLLGEGLSELKRFDEAIATFERAARLSEDSLDLLAGGAEDRLRYIESSTNTYDGLVHAYASSGRARDALQAAERGRARMLLDMLSAGHGGEDELSDAERERRIELDTALAALNERIAAERERARGAQPDRALTAELDRVRRTRNEFYLGLDARHPSLRFARGVAPVLTDREIAATLPRGSALVEFVVAPRGAWVLMLKPRAGGEPRLIARPAGLPAARLTALAAEFTRQVGTRDLAFGPNARALYDALFGPIAQDLAGVERLIVVPHGSLWEVPFQALQTPRQKYLVEEHAVASAPSASALKALDSRRRPRAAAPRVIAFGDPRIADPKTPALPHAAREAREVASLYGGSAATDAEATEARFRLLAPGADVIHIATHGVLDNTSPMFSYVMLSGGGTARAGDGRLEGRELINMRLDAELVVLSACETARGRIANGEGVVGLSWALFAAGASTTAVSLWPVDSASTTDLMSSFHRQRRQLTKASSPAPTAQALRAAQLQSLARPESRHPFYWAGFVVIGVP